MSSDENRTRPWVGSPGQQWACFDAIQRNWFAHQGDLQGISNMTSSLPKIEKGVPLPLARGSGSGAPWPFDEMEVGDSFFATQISTSSLLTFARRHRPKRFTTRKVTENGVTGIRIWRIE